MGLVDVPQRQTHRLRRCDGPQRYAIDGALAIGIAAFTVIAALLADTPTRELDGVGLLLLFVASFALVARRRFPVAVLTITAAAALWYQAQGYPSLMTTLPVPFAVYTAVSKRRHRQAVIALGVVSLAVAGCTNFLSDTPDGMQHLGEAKFMLFGWLLAGGVMAAQSRHRQAYIEQVEQRAHEAERTREEMARRRASDERLRIARDLHDSLTHSISIIKVQAGVAIHLARKHGEPVPSTLLAIEEASSEAVRELRSTLEVLRQPGAGDGDVTGSGLDRLDHLVERTRSVGVPTTVTVDGDHCSLPRVVDETAYRIVQESLTNVARHAGPNASASVHLSFDPDEVVVTVTDDGTGSAGQPPIPGVGLIGMRERVAALGGRLSAAPRDDGGFRVAATLPLTAVDGTARPLDGVPAAAPADRQMPATRRGGGAVDASAIDATPAGDAPATTGTAAEDRVRS